MRNMCPTIKSWLVFSDIVVLLPFRITVGNSVIGNYVIHIGKYYHMR